MMNGATLSNREIAWWLMGTFLKIAIAAVVLFPVGLAGWYLVFNAIDAQAEANLAEAPKVAATMQQIARLTPPPKVCDIDTDYVASCEIFTTSGERRVLQVSGGR